MPIYKDAVADSVKCNRRADAGFHIGYCGSPPVGGSRQRGMPDFRHTSRTRSAHRGNGRPGRARVGRWSSCRRGVDRPSHGSATRGFRPIPMIDRERHRSGRIGWLRAAVLGANDGVVSTASLVIGVAAGRATRSEVLLAGIAGMAAGALSMAAGEYVSVSSQADTERADVELEDRRAVQPPSRPCRPRRGDRLSSWQGCWGR